MKFKYVNEHNNYDLTLGNIYEAYSYSRRWIHIAKDDKGNNVLYRAECFEKVH